MKAKFEERTCAELNEAIPQTETLNVEAQRDRAELARQGSLAERQPPAGLVELRQKLTAETEVLAGEESEGSIVRRSNHTSLQSSSIPVVEGFIGVDTEYFVSYYRVWIARHMVYYILSKKGEIFTNVIILISIGPRWAWSTISWLRWRWVG